MRSESFSVDESDLVPAAEVRAQLTKIEGSLEKLREIARSADATSRPTAKQVAAMIKARRIREKILGPNLFSDPAWDLLLEAYLAKLNGTTLSVSGLSMSAAVPSTTALRWIHKLEQDGWLVRQDDPRDARRTWIELTATGNAKLANYFMAVSSGALPI